MVYKDYGIRHPVARRPKVKKPSTLPKTYHFQGKAYTSLPAYSSAVAAARAAAVTTAAAGARAAQLAKESQLLAAKEAESRARMSQYREQAAAEARRQSQRIALLAEQRHRATQRVGVERLAALRRQAVGRELLASSRVPRDETNAIRAGVTQRAEQDRLARARRGAYDNLAQRSATALRAAASGAAPIARRPLVPERQAPKYQQRNTLVRQAETSGDWSTALRTLQAESRASNGRRVDTRLLDAVYTKYVAPVQRVRDEFTALVGAMIAAQRGDDDEALRRLVEDPDNIALNEQFLKLFGDGTKPGTFTPHQEILSQISASREQSWASQMTLGPQSSSAEIQELTRRVARESRVRGARPAGLAPQFYDERYVDLEFSDRVLDPATGQMKEVKRTGVDAWLAREQFRERARAQENQRQTALQRGVMAGMMGANGRTFRGFDGQGRLLGVDNAVTRQRAEIRQFLPQWTLNEQGIPSRIAAAASQPAVQEQIIREFMRDAEASYDARNGDLRRSLREGSARERAGWAVPRGARLGGISLDAGDIEYRRRKEAWLSGLATRLGKPEWGQLDRLSTTGLGGVAQGALTAMSFFPAVIRNRLQQDFGDFQPHVDIGGLTPWDDASIQLGRTADPTAAAARQRLATAGGTGDFWQDLGAWGSAVRDNAMWGSGNLGGVLTSATDPLMLSGPGRFMQAGALAIGRAGGLRTMAGIGLRGGLPAALPVGRDVLADFARYSLPKGLRGAGRDVVRTEMAKLRLGQRLGMDTAAALRMTDDDFRRFADDIAADRTAELLKSDIVDQMTKATGIEKTQLLNMAQQELPRILDEFKIFAEDPFEAAARMRDVRKAAIRARSEAESAAQLVGAQSRRAVEMQALADVTGRPLKFSEMSPAKLAKHDRLLVGYDEAAQQYLNIAESGARAADEIESGRLAADPRRLRGVQAQLRDSVREMEKYQDSWRLDKHGRKKVTPDGLVSRRFRQLMEFRGGADPTAPSFVDQSLKQVAYDTRRVDGLVRQAVQKLRATPLDQRLSSEWTSRLKQLRLAQRGLMQEKAMLDGGRTMSRSYLKRPARWARVQNSITPQRLAPVANNAAEMSRGIGQDYMAALGNSKVRDVVKLSAKQEQAWGALRPQLDEAADLSLLAGAMDDDQLRLLTRALGRAPSTLELWTVLRLSASDPGWIALRPALRRVETQMVIQARRAGFTFRGRVRDAADSLWDIVRDEHSLSGAEALGAAGHRSLDGRVQAALVAWRKFRAEGQVRLRERRFAEPSGAVDSVFHDSDPFENLVKMRTLGGDGTSLFAYDELRGVLGRSMLREDTGKGILKRAAVRARDEGLSLDEAIDAERVATARREVERNVEEWFSRADMQGLPPEARLRAFEEKLMLDDLPVGIEYQISPYQEQALRRAFEEKLGFSVDDKHQIARYFRGELDVMPEGARLPRVGEYMDFAEAEGINLWVVPKGHAKVGDVIPFGGRARELDNDIEAMLRGIDDELIAADKIVPPQVDRAMGKAEQRVALPGSGELTEAEAARRGMIPRSAEDRPTRIERSTRRNFQDGSGARSGRVNQQYARSHGWHENAAPQGWEQNPNFVEFPVEAVGDFAFTPVKYRQWLWDEMRRSSEMRNLLARLKGKQIVYSKGGHARILADAVEWMKTSQAREMFAPKSSHVGLTALDQAAGTRDQVLEQLAKYETAYEEVQELAGLTPSPAAGRWERAQIGDMALDEEGFVVELVKSVGLKGQVTRNRWVPVRDRQISRDDLPRLVDLYGQPHRVKAKTVRVVNEAGKVNMVRTGEVSGTHVFRVTDEQLVKRFGGDDPTGSWARKMSAYSAKIKSLKAELKDLDAGRPSRHRGSVGVSIHGEGVFIREGTSNITVAHEIFHQFWDDDFNVVWRSDIEDAIDLMGLELRTELWGRVRIGKKAYDPAEFAAELYALWRVGESAGSDVLYDWSDLRSLRSLRSAHPAAGAGPSSPSGSARARPSGRPVSPGPGLEREIADREARSAGGAFLSKEFKDRFDAETARLRGLLGAGDLAASGALDRLGQIFTSHAPRVVDTIRGQLRYPPFAANHRSRLMKWMADNGYHSPRTAEAIRAGEHVWPAADERRMWMSLWGYEAPWTDEDVLRVILNDPRLHNVALRQWGFFDDDFQTVAGADGLKPEQLADALVWGREGMKQQRTIAEMRKWAIQRYGQLVSEDGKTLIRMPWLMKADDEYVRWTAGFFDDAFEGAQRPSLLAARDKLPQAVRDYLFDGDTLRSVGMQIDPRLVKAKELDKLRDAIVNATRRRLKRMQKVGDVEPGDWLAQEQLRFAYDITNQLLTDPTWRGMLRGKPILGTVLHLWGQLWRLLVSLQPAFPIMNLIESYGFKRLYLTVYQGGFRPLSLDTDGLRLLPGNAEDVLRKIGSESDSVFHLSGGSPWVRVGDGYLSLNQRGGSLIQGITELPVRVSKFGEDALRADFARRVAGDTFRTARRTGMSVENAEWLAKHQAKIMVDSFFAVANSSGWLAALNDLVPFFSYNFKNKTLAVRILWNHPSVWVWGERLRREVEAANREQWAKDHPGIEFPEGPSASWLWWKVGEDYYKIDLSAFSDWTRAIGGVMEDHTPLGWLTEFIRVPHPSQVGALAMFTGEDTPWGNPGSIRELSFWADLFYWTKGIDYADPRKRRDFIQIMSQMLFFKKFGKIGMMDLKQATFFSLRQVDEDQARAYLEANPDLQLYWDSLPPKQRVLGFDPMTSTHFRQLMTDAENREYDQALEALDAFNARADAAIAKYAAAPWSEEYKAAKRDLFILRKAFMAEHPILTRAWGTFMSPGEFAKLDETFRVDDLADAWYNWKRPESADFKDDLVYQRALVDFNERRAQFLAANPALQRRLMEGRNAVETAWLGQELHWTEVLDFQARLKIRILEEEAKGDPDDELIEALYSARDFASADLDADRFGVFEGPNSERKGFFASLPGFADFQYAKATPEERKQLKHDEWYSDTLSDISKKATSGKHWYELAQANPAFMQEYWTRNPQKKAEYDANGEYIRWIGSWARKLQADNFAGAQAVWDTMPAWVKERYFVKHPDSKMRDGAGGGGGTSVQYNGQWFKSPESRDRYIMFVEGGDGQPSTAVQHDGKWFKSPESRDRYIQFIKNGGTGTFAEPFAEVGEPTFRSAESRQRFLDGQAYFASISGWVELLKAKDFVAADRHFRAMPDWMKEKYYAKHPDQRAKNDLDSQALRQGAEYFLATGDDKLAILVKYPELRQWLADNGGDEGAMRGLLNAMYRAIPTSEPWLKRTFRERFPEIFSQEAAGDRRLDSVARDLAENPEMAPFFAEALKLQSRLFMEQLKLNKVWPRPFTVERKSRLLKRGKRRAARMSSHWTLHNDIRRGRS